MRILVLGSDGYIGVPLSLHLERLGHDVTRVDNFSRRKRAAGSLTAIGSFPTIKLDVMDLALSAYGPFDTIVHLAQMPSAPWSMASKKQALLTQQENTIGNLSLLWEMKNHSPEAHLVKLGSMGEYGTPEISIPEGFIDDSCLPQGLNTGGCPMKGMMFPRQPGSFYHLSKVFDSMNIEFACRMWGLRSTDIMQGVVFGLNYWDEQFTRFDYDEAFGTVINRFCAQAIAGYPLTVYGVGGQTRGYLPLRDSIRCLTLAIENPPNLGEYRVFNQYAKFKSVLEIAEIVQELSIDKVEIQHIPNPRIEKECHTYDSTNEGLRKLGYNPQWVFEEEVIKLLEVISPFKGKINKSVIMPTSEWK